MTVDVVLRLEQRLPALSQTERRIAEAVIADPHIVVASTIAELATRCETSQASVVRFCRATGFEGYKEFRLAVAGNQSREDAALASLQVSEAEITVDDSTATLITKVAYQQTRAIEETARQLDTDALERVVTAVASADRINIYGAGSSSLAAADLHQKLLRLDLPAATFPDPHMALTAAALSTPGRLAIAFSHTGRTTETIAYLKAARTFGATAVLFTNSPDGPAADHADIHLLTHVRESEIRAGAISSRLAQFAVVDYLVVRLLQSDLARFGEPLRRTREAVQTLRSTAL